MTKLPDFNSDAYKRADMAVTKLIETEQGRAALAYLVGKAMSLAIRHIRYELSKPDGEKK